MIGRNNKKSKIFEIKLVIRDKEGNPTGRHKVFSSDDADKVAGFLDKGKARKRRKKKGSAQDFKKNKE